jgi:hypothetical protein
LVDRGQEEEVSGKREKEGRGEGIKNILFTLRSGTILRFEYLAADEEKRKDTSEQQDTGEAESRNGNEADFSFTTKKRSASGVELETAQLSNTRRVLIMLRKLRGRTSATVSKMCRREGKDGPA